MISGSFFPMRCGVADYTYRLSRCLADKGNEIDNITAANWKVMITDYHDAGIRVLPVVAEWDLSTLPGILRFVKTGNPDIIHIQYAISLYKDPLAVYFLPLMIKRRFNNKSAVVVSIHEVGRPLVLPYDPMKSLDDFGKIRRTFVPTSELVLKSIIGLRKVKTFEALGFANRDDFEGVFRDLDIGLDIFLDHSDVVIVTNEEHQSYVWDQYPEIRERIRLIPLGVSIHVGRNPSEEVRDETRRKLGVNEGSSLLSFFGYILPGKGLETLLGALKQLITSGIQAHLVIVGGLNEVVGDQRYVDEVRTLAKELGIGKYVLWMGFSSEDEISRYLFSSDICILPYDEGISFRRQTFITALSHGLPIITTKGIQTSPKIAHGENAYLVPSKDPMALAEAVRTLCASKELRETLMRGAQKLVAEFSWNSITDKTIECYRWAKSR